MDKWKGQSPSLLIPQQMDRRETSLLQETHEMCIVWLRQMILWLLRRDFQMGFNVQQYQNQVSQTFQQLTLYSFEMKDESSWVQEMTQKFFRVGFKNCLCHSSSVIPAEELACLVNVCSQAYYFCPRCLEWLLLSFLFLWERIQGPSFLIRIPCSDIECSSDSFKTSFSWTRCSLCVSSDLLL
jgi:hypothetical protein